MSFRNNEQKQDFLGQEARLADRSEPQFRRKQFMNDRYRERMVGTNESTRMDIPSMTTNHLANAINELDKLVKELKTIKTANIPYNIKIMSFRSLVTSANHDLRRKKEREIRLYDSPNPKIKKHNI